ncbi:hypothetical protein [Tsukamurella sp. PLM1]|uniref:TetR/AcrR family transcriptional regulator n=1 Tax=Tsukamurella sp. PLM1 TaxID=2929795 RepID=UPI0020C041D7|nr:hypothetical protein [Tsukamurella sp. PLM1]
MLRGAFRAWESPEAGAGVRAALRAAAVDTVGNHSTLGEFVSSEMIPTVMSVTGIPKESARVLASTVLGLAFMRYLVRAPAFTEVSVDELIASYAPVIQGIVDADAHPARS